MHKFQRHHLDRRAAKLVADSAAANSPDMLRTRDVADWLGVSTQWLEIGRIKGYGPPYVRFSPRNIRYSRKDVVAWLKKRSRFVP
jgi:hypothetical protein